MKIATVLLCGALSTVGLSGCETGSMHKGDRPKLNISCSGGAPCQLPVNAQTGGIFSNRCTVDAYDYDTTQIGVGVDVTWTLGSKWIGHLEFAGSPGVNIENPLPDFVNGRFGDGGNDQGIYIWTGDKNRNMVPRKYSFSVVWIKPGVDIPIPCGTIDPTIVNSL